MVSIIFGALTCRSDAANLMAETQGCGSYLWLWKIFLKGSDKRAPLDWFGSINVQSPRASWSLSACGSYSIMHIV
jgi:hypothetical protein